MSDVQIDGSNQGVALVEERVVDAPSNIPGVSQREYDMVAVITGIAPKSLADLKKFKEQTLRGGKVENQD